MRTRSFPRASSRRLLLSLRTAPAGFTLIECVVYVALLFLIIGLAFMTFYRTEQNHRNLSRNSDDILRVLRAGEQWREDVRRAAAPIRLGEAGAENEIIIPQTNLTVKYLFRQESVWRQAGPLQTEALSSVAASKMEQDARQRVTAWRWEVELKGRQRVARVKPLFTFMAAAREDKQ
jgi:type II secretory pathway component PulJ